MGGLENATQMPFLWDRAAAAVGGIDDSCSWMKITFFVCKIRFRTHTIIIQGHNHELLTVRCGGGLTLTVILAVKRPFFLRLHFQGLKFVSGIIPKLGVGAGFLIFGNHFFVLKTSRNAMKHKVNEGESHI